MLYFQLASPLHAQRLLVIRAGDGANILMSFKVQFDTLLGSLTDDCLQEEGTVFEGP